VNPQHLLELAARSSTLAAGRPRQANLRRAVSTVYYALFHALTQSGAKLIGRRDYLRRVIARKFTHAAMKKVSEEFGQGKFPILVAIPFSEVPDELVEIARLFVRLQQERHRADYDAQAVFVLSAVNELVAQGKAALLKWSSIEAHPAAELYLLAMLFQPLGR